MVQPATLRTAGTTTGAPREHRRRPGRLALRGAPTRPQVDITIPVYNEEADLEPSVGGCTPT